ncbi:MAG: STAS/SEC14 domain-containing protein [Trueperaceae bacterium]|nr:STAS/SEC14 domain-containing protein [Trueperaceae bacterium]
MYNLETTNNGQTVIFDVQGSLSKEEYEKLKKELEPLFKQHDKLDLVVDVSGLSGMSVGAVGQDLTYTLKHFTDFRRIAVVGDSTWQKWLAGLGDKLPGIEMKYFDESSRDRAETWVTT